jgi:hypothetical protein
MATLNSSNITDGNTVEPNDLLQLYDAFTSGGGTTGAYNVTVSGSLIGNASTSTSSSYALSASFATSSSRAVSSSFATTASFALNATTIATQVNNQAYNRAGLGPVEANFKFIAGYLKLSGGTASSPNFPQLAGKVLGVNAFITATISAPSATSGNVVFVKDILASGSITVVTAGGTGTEDVNFTCMYVA